MAITEEITSLDCHPVDCHPVPKPTLKRDRTHINADILRICIPGARKTKIVYQANLNFNVLKVYLQRLIVHNLLETHSQYYYTTEKGLRYISHTEALVV